MLKSLIVSRYALAFALSAPFFFGAVQQVPEIVAKTDALIAPAGVSTGDFRRILGDSSGLVLADLSSRSPLFDRYK